MGRKLVHPTGAEGVDASVMPDIRAGAAVPAEFDIVQVLGIAHTKDADQLMRATVEAALACVRLFPNHQVQHLAVDFTPSINALSILCVEVSCIVGTARNKSTGRRIPAANLETLVITKLRSFLADEGAVLNTIREEHVDGAAQSRLIARSVKIAKEIKSLTPDGLRVMLMALINRIDIRSDCVEISVRRSRLFELLRSGSIELVKHQGTPDNEATDILTMTVRARLQRVGREMKMLVENTDHRTESDAARVLRKSSLEPTTLNSGFYRTAGKMTLHPVVASKEQVTHELSLTPTEPSFLYQLTDITERSSTGEESPQTSLPLPADSFDSALESRWLRPPSGWCWVHAG